MRIDLRLQKDQTPVPVVVNPRKAENGFSQCSLGNGKTVELNWRETLTPAGGLSRCPVCNCRELFARRDFPQRTGLAIVAIGAVAAMVLWSLGQVIWGFAALGAVTLIDALIVPFVGRCLVCYRCRSEFRDLPIPRSHPGWDLATGEKYR